MIMQQHGIEHERRRGKPNSAPRPVRGVRGSLAQDARLSLLDWMADRPPGARLPSERKLALMLNISVRTVRKALADMAEAGEIVRSARKIFAGNNPGFQAVEEHPLAAFRGFRRAAYAPLNMVSFEILPHQKRIWNEIAERFNSVQGSARLVLHDLPREVDSPELYADFIRRNRIDLALLNAAMIEPLVHAGALAPIPADIAGDFRSDSSLWSSLISGRDGGEICAAPLVHGFALFAWNTDMTGDEFDSADCSADALRAARWLGSAAARMRNGQLAAVNPGAMVIAAGLDFHPKSAGDIRRNMENAADVALELMKIEQIRFAVDPARHSGVRAFAEGRAAFASGPSFLLLNVLRNAAFPWRAAVALPPEPYLAPSGVTKIGITAPPSRAAAAEEAVRFMVSREAQTLFAARGMNCPIRKDGMAPLAGFIGAPEDAFVRHMERHRLICDHQAAYWLWAVTDPMALCVSEAVTRPRRPGRDEIIARMATMV